MVATNLHLHLLFTISLLCFVRALPPGCLFPNGPAKAFYFTTNSEQNAVVALPIAGDGMLGGGKITATGGSGIVAVDGTGQPVADDGLFSQSALTVAGRVSTNIQRLTTSDMHEEYLRRQFSL
jgi:hypothetical protein